MQATKTTTSISLPLSIISLLLEVIVTQRFYTEKILAHLVIYKEFLNKIIKSLSSSRNKI